MSASMLPNMPDGPDPYICGSTFNSIDEARDILLRYTVARGLSYRVESSDRKRKYILACRSKECKFCLRISIAKSGTAQTTASSPHTCPPEIHEVWKPASSVKYLRSRHQGASTAKEIRGLERSSGNNISYKQSWRPSKA